MFVDFQYVTQESRMLSPGPKKVMDDVVAMVPTVCVGGRKRRIGPPRRGMQGIPSPASAY